LSHNSSFFFLVTFDNNTNIIMTGNRRMSSQRAHTSQTTEINAPISVVWEHLSALDEWSQWNPSVRLPADYVLGQWCKAKIAVCNRTRTGRNSKGGDGEQKMATATKKRWMSTNCIVDEMGNGNEYSITWTVRRGFFKNVTSMKLSCGTCTRKTTLTHTQSIHGPPFSFPAMGLSSPRDLLTNSACINQCFKNHVECLHFQSLLMDASHRGMSCSNKSSAASSKKSSSHHPNLYHSSTSMTGREEEEEEEEEETTSDSGGFWTSSAQIRNAVVSQLVEEAVPASYCVMLKN
jgi:hypothetical protein